MLGLSFLSCPASRFRRISAGAAGGCLRQGHARRASTAGGLAVQTLPQHTYLAATLPAAPASPY